MIWLNWLALFNAITVFLHQSRWNITMDLCWSFNSLRYCLYWSGGISCWLAAPSNLTCKLVLVDVRIFSLSCKSCWEISVSCSQPSAMECNLFSSVDGAMLLHKCIFIYLYVFNISLGILAFISMHNIIHMSIVLFIG